MNKSQMDAADRFIIFVATLAIVLVIGFVLHIFAVRSKETTNLSKRKEINEKTRKLTIQLLDAKYLSAEWDRVEKELNAAFTEWNRLLAEADRIQEAKLKFWKKV